MSFGTQLQKLRKERRLTLKVLADQIGCSKGYLSGIENEKVNPPSEKFVRRLAQLLEIDEVEFLKLAYLEKIPNSIRSEFDDVSDQATAPLLNTWEQGYPVDVDRESGALERFTHTRVRLPGLQGDRNVVLTVRDESLVDADGAGTNVGDLVILEATEINDIQSGDLVYAVFRTTDGKRAVLRRFERNGNDTVHLVAVNPTTASFEVNRDDVDVILKVVGSVNYFVDRIGNDTKSSNTLSTTTI